MTTRMTKHLLVLVLALIVAAPFTAAAQSAQQLFEKGAYAEAAQRVNSERDAGNNDPAATYLAGLALEKMNRGQDARAEYARLSNGGDETWKAIGQSAIGALDNNLDEAVNEARKARDASGESGFASYQLGLVHLKRGEFGEAAQAFDRAAELMPQFAYAFYNAGVAHQRAKNFNRMAEHFTVFMKLAPEAPERKQVQLALAALRG
jgi:tetratricopeptide (TPR) repeat protein